MSAVAASTSHQTTDLEKFKRSYQIVKAEFQAGKKTAVPSYIAPLFEKGPGAFLKLNSSVYDKQKELPEEYRAFLVM